MNDHDNEDSKRLERIERELKEQQERRENLVRYLIIGVVIAVIIFAFWNNHRINGDIPDPGIDCAGGGESCN